MDLPDLNPLDVLRIRQIHHFVPSFYRTITTGNKASVVSWIISNLSGRFYLVHGAPDSENQNSDMYEVGFELESDLTLFCLKDF